MDVGNDERKKELHKALISVLSIKEYMAFTYVIQFFDSRKQYVVQG